MDYTKIQPSKNWLTVLNNNEQDFADRLQLTDWKQCTLMNGTTGNLSVRWSKEFLEIVGDVTLSDKTKAYTFAQVPADLNGILSGPYKGQWEDVWVASGQGATLYQIALKTGASGNVLYFYRQFNGNETTASTVVHVHNLWLKHLE